MTDKELMEQVWNETGCAEPGKPAQWTPHTLKHAALVIKDKNRGQKPSA